MMGAEIAIQDDFTSAASAGEYPDILESQVLAHSRDAFSQSQRCRGRSLQLGCILGETLKTHTLPAVSDQTSNFHH